MNYHSIYKMDITLTSINGISCEYSAPYLAIFYTPQEIRLKLYDRMQEPIYEQNLKKGMQIKYLDKNLNVRYIVI